MVYACIRRIYSNLAQFWPTEIIQSALQCWHIVPHGSLAYYYCSLPFLEQNVYYIVSLIHLSPYYLLIPCLPCWHLGTFWILAIASIELHSPSNRIHPMNQQHRELPKKASTQDHTPAAVGVWSKGVF